MNRPVSLIDVVTRWRWFRNGATRRLVLAVLILVLAIFAVFPRVYVGNVKLAPQDTDTTGLRSIVTQLGGNYAALLGQHEPVEVDLAIGRSFEVQQDVARRMGLVEDKSLAGIRDAVRELDDHVEVRALRAGILEIEVKGRDPEAVVRTAGTYAKVMQERLAKLSKEQTDYKEVVLADRMAAATKRLASAKRAITEFRNRNNVITPEAQMEDAVAALSTLRAQRQVAQVQLAKLRQVNTDENIAVKAVLGEIEGLDRQIALAQNRVATQGGLTASGMAPRALEYERLDLDLKFAQSVYESYVRYLEGAAIERLTADFNIQIIEPAFGWHFNTIPALLLILVVLIAVAAEFFYFRPPPGIALEGT
jgi:uncharacterized protein involved in exopolysaccharide biosynthesis